MSKVRSPTFGKFISSDQETCRRESCFTPFSDLVEQSANFVATLVGWNAGFIVRQWQVVVGVCR
jgi:hypothetical protein